MNVRTRILLVAGVVLLAAGAYEITSHTPSCLDQMKAQAVQMHQQGIQGPPYVSCMGSTK